MLGFMLSCLELVHFPFSLGNVLFYTEGNGNPLQYSCLETPVDGGVWRAVVYGVAQSQTRLKRLSSSSSSNTYIWNLERWYQQSYVQGSKRDTKNKLLDSVGEGEAGMI